MTMTYQWTRPFFFCRRLAVGQMKLAQFMYVDGQESAYYSIQHHQFLTHRSPRRLL